MGLLGVGDGEQVESGISSHLTLTLSVPVAGHF